MLLAIYIGVIIISGLIVWKGGELLETSSEALARHYNLPPVVEGSIIMALGSSFPELSTTVVSTLIHGKFDLGISAVIGSAIFNILVIPGLSVIFGGKIKSDRILVYKDAQFYITSVAVLLLAFSMAVIYNPVVSEETKGIMSRPIALLPVMLYMLYIFLQTQETRDYNKKREKNTPHKNIKKQWFVLFVSLVLILVSVEGLVRSAIFMGDYFDTPSFYWGITIIAGATSVPDAVVSIRSAINKRGIVSISNVLGSNIFDLLIAVPAGVLIAGSTVINFSAIIPLMIFLTFSTILLFAFMRTSLTLQKAEAWILLCCYFVFIAWMVLEAMGYIGFMAQNMN